MNVQAMTLPHPVFRMPRQSRTPSPPSRPTGPCRASAWARALRWLADHCHVIGTDDRLLRDAGLTREDVARGVSFGRCEASRRTQSSLPARVIGLEYSAGMRRIGTLDARAWQLKLYVPAAANSGLRSEDKAAAARAFRAVVAGPRAASVSGFATLRMLHSAEMPMPAGTLTLTAWWWEGAILHRLGLLLPVGGGPVRRAPECMSDVPEILLIASECRVWQRLVLDAEHPDLTAYLAEDCT